jgi:hypothetical protein
MSPEFCPNPEPLVPLALTPEDAKLLLLAARARHLTSAEYLSLLVECERLRR